MNQEHQQHRQQQHQTQEQQLTRREKLLHQLHQQVQHQQQELQKFIFSHNHFRLGIVILVLFLIKNETL